MRKDQVIIFVMIAAIVFSAFATTLVLLTEGDSDVAANETADTSAQTEQEEPVNQIPQELLDNEGNPVGEWPVAISGDLKELQKEDLREGTGETVQLGDTIVVHYRLATGEGEEVPGNNTFGGQPIAFQLAPGQLIEGWTNGIPGMKVGGFRRLKVPAEQAYGPMERPGIPANSDLVFDVEVLAVNP